MRIVVAAILLILVGCSDNIVISDYSAPPTRIINTPAQWPAPLRHITLQYDTTWTEGPQGFVGIGIENQDLLKPHNYTMVSDTLLHPIRAGWKSERFELVRGDCYTTDCFRQPVFERVEYAEEVGGEGGWYSGQGSEFWYGWSFFVPSHINSHPNVFGWSFITQFQQFPTAEPAWVFFKSSGQGGGNPFCLVGFIGTGQDLRNFVCEGHNRYQIIQHDDFFDSWYDVVVHARWSTSSEGFLRVWINDQLVVDRNGQTTTVGNNSVYFKYGLYRAQPNVGPANPNLDARGLVYFDEVRKGFSRDEVDIRRLLN